MISWQETMPQPMMRPKTYIHLECYLTKDYIQWYSNRRKSGKVPIEPEMKLKLNELGLGRLRSLNRSQYVKVVAGTLTNTYSNGETGFMKFIESIVPDRLYIL